MKIKNLAFFGIMAAIMGVAGTARADTTTVIASQAYVDAKDALKQNLLKSGDNGNVVVSGSGNVVTGITADGQGTVTVTKGNVDVSAAVHDGIRDNETTTAPSENAVYDAIHVASNGNYIVAGNAVNTNLSNLDTATKAAADAAAAAQTTANSKWATENVAVQGDYEKGWSDESVKQESDGAQNSNLGGAKTQKDKYVPTMLAVEKYVAANAGTSIGSATQNATDNEVITGVTTNNGKVSSVTSTKIKNAHVSSTAGDEIEATKLALTSGYTAADTDADVAAGEKVQTAIGKLAKRSKDNQTNIGTNTTNIGTLTNLSTTAKNNLVAAINELDIDINNLDTNKQNKSDSTVPARDANDAPITYNYITSGEGVGANLVKLDTQAKTNAENITIINTTLQGKQDTLTFDDSPTASSTNPVKSGGVYTALAGKQASFNDGTQNGTGLVKEVSQTGGTVSATASLGVYVSDMNNALKGVSSNSTAACTKGSPCTLTYYKDGTNEYMRWTPMDTESTDADTTAADSSNA